MALGYPWLPHFLLPSNSHHWSCLLLHSLSTTKPSHRTFSFDGVVLRVEGSQASVMDFLPQVIHTEVVEILSNYSLFLGVIPLGLCLSYLSPSFPVCLFILYTSKKCTPRHTGYKTHRLEEHLPGNKTFKRLAPTIYS